jgi:anthranilate phosphoribosyltransferase
MSESVADGARAVLRQLLEGRAVPADRLGELLSWTLAGELDDALVAALLTALRVVGVDPRQLAAMRQSVLSVAELVPLDDELRAGCVDIVGTGGDGKYSVNISTMAAIVAAAAGATVCKHGNRAASSACGAADVLEHLGADLDAPTPDLVSSLVDVGFAFCFAPRHHPTFGAVAAVRRALGFRTVFNLLGPMCNPARPSRLLIGVADECDGELLAAALALQPDVRAWVVHSAGYDELTTVAPAAIVEVRSGAIKRFELDPRHLGFSRGAPNELEGGSVEQNSRELLALLDGKRGTIRDSVVLNAGAALLVSDRAGDLGEACALASAAIDSGASADVLKRYLVAASVRL